MKYIFIDRVANRKNRGRRFGRMILVCLAFIGMFIVFTGIILYLMERLSDRLKMD
jgi:hypothetical protein